MSLLKKFTALNRWQRNTSYFLTALITYAGFGFLLLPIILQPIIVDTLTEEMHRVSRLEKLEINPFALSVTLHNLEISGKRTDQLLSLKKLHVNIQAVSLFKQAICFDEISIVNPSIDIKILSNGEYNFQDLMVANDSEPESTDENAQGWPIEIAKFRYVDGTIKFSDENRSTPFYSQLEGLSISLDDFSTRPGDGNLHHVQAETLRGTSVDWNGEFSLSPLHSKGTLKMAGDLTIISDYMQDQMLVVIDKGLININTNYEFSFASDVAEFTISKMLASITDISVRHKDNNNEIIYWKDFSVDLEELDVLNKKIVINKISSQDVLINANKMHRVELDIADFFVLQNLKEKDEEEHSAVEDESAWDIVISNIQHNNLNFNLNDTTVAPMVKHSLLAKSIHISNLKPFTNEEAAVKLDLLFNGITTIAIEGSVKPKSKTIIMDIDVNALELKKYQSYINDVAYIDLLGGSLNSKINLNIDASGAEAKIKFLANTNITNLKIRDKKLKEEVLSWKKVSVNKLKFDSVKRSMNIDLIKINSPYARVVLSEGGETNVGNLVVNNNNKEKVVSKADPLNVSIKKVTINNGKMNFSDSTLKPNFTAGIYSLKGDIRGLSSKELSKAKVNLKGKVDKYAPVIIKGEINPLSEDAYTEIAIIFKGIELTTFTPYSGKFAGYKIEKGKLTLDLNYKLSKNELIAENRVILDQLSLGEETGSEDATSLPVNFALSLLKDSNGVIDFNLPIRGNVDDPDFHYGSLVWGALGNLIVGIVSSPFKALGGLIGGDSEGLDYVVFPANADQLSDAEKVKLDSLAGALLQRPTLHLEVRGVSSSLIDHDEIAYIEILNRLKMKLRPLSAKLNEDEQDDIVDFYEDTSKKSADDFLPKEHKLTPQQVEAMKFDKALNSLLLSINVTDKQYLDLAHRRAAQVQKYLIEVGNVPSGNIYLLDSEIEPDIELENVEMATLKLPLGLKAK